MAAVMAALMAVGTHGAVHEVVEWSANYGYCKTQPPRRLAIPTVEAVVGDAVHFKFSVDSAWNMDATQWAGHEVYKYGTKEAWEACAQDISETPTMLVAWGTMGGNCTGDYPHACMVNSPGYVKDLDTVGTEYYAAVSAGGGSERESERASGRCLHGVSVVVCSGRRRGMSVCVYVI